MVVKSLFLESKWIKRELGLDTNERVIFSHDKYEHAVKEDVIGVLIDDYDKNINLFREIVVSQFIIKIIYLILSMRWRL